MLWTQSTMNYFLKISGFDVHSRFRNSFITATKLHMGFDSGHIATVLTHHNELYLMKRIRIILPVAPVPFSGVKSSLCYRRFIVFVKNDRKGKLHLRDAGKTMSSWITSSADDWTLGYAFYIEKWMKKKQIQHKKLSLNMEGATFK